MYSYTGSTESHETSTEDDGRLVYLPLHHVEYQVRSATNY